MSFGFAFRFRFLQPNSAVVATGPLEWGAGNGLEWGSGNAIKWGD